MNSIYETYLEKAKQILLSTLKFELNSWEDESKKLRYINREDVFMLAENILLLENHDLHKLNEQLFLQRRKPNDILTEHTVAAELLRNHGSNIMIKYEPQIGKNTDYVLTFNEFEGKTFNIQIKNSNPTERENKRNKIIRNIKSEMKEVKVPRWYSITMHENFNSTNINGLIEFIKQNLHIPDNIGISYYADGVMLSKIKFSKMTNPNVDCMLLGSTADMDMINITGEERNHFFGALCKASSSFDKQSDDNNINLIISETNTKDNIDVAAAIYGDELNFYNNVENNSGWTRAENGFYHSNDSKNVTAIVSLKKNESRQISSFSKKVFFKHIHNDAGDAILSLLRLDRIIASNTYINDRY
ncbi:hypothetical protein [Paenibacillus sp. FSL H8-0034]|uniref:hypothetical protein n=1 Tax=Paenibacillus sp. FSL H8-0034 TaxID=2954671 RepID=UPI0030F8676D